MRLRFFALFVLPVLLCSDSLGADVWRLAGTFNGWNTTDDTWRLAPVSDERGTYELVRRIEAGRHHFKFVRNGDWAEGHLGAGDESLEQPGNDIELVIRAAAEYRVRLDAARQSWSFEVASVPEPVVLLSRFGSPVAGRSFVIDASGSLFPPGAEASLEATATADYAIRVSPNTPLRAEVIPARPGRLTIPVTVRLGDEVATSSLSVDVSPAYSVRYQTRDHDRSRTVQLEAFDEGLARAALNIPAATSMATLDVLEGEESILSLRGGRVDAGDYVVEVRDGNATTHQSSVSPMCLLPGFWHRFEFEPTSDVSTVHVVGDFNDWVGPGGAGAIALSSRTDGSWAALVNLPAGAHRYKYVIDGSVWILDPVAERTITDSDGNLNSVFVVGPSPDDYPPARRNHINEAALQHNPDLERDFAPIEGDLGLVDISIAALPGDAERVELHVDAADEEMGLVTLIVPMNRTRDLAGFDRFSARVMLERGKADYKFVVMDGRARFDTERFQGRVEPRLDLPAWAMGAVWYQIFPERFRNGNPENDPHGPGVYQMPWMANWYETQPGEESQWRRRANLSPTDPLPERQGGEIFNWIFDRRYGGDLQGVVEKLDELQDLGITAIYFNPVFEAESMHKYDASDYRHIDDNFGNPPGHPVPARWAADPTETLDPATWKWTPADRYFLDVLLPECRKRDIRVVIDGVFNHTGREFWAFQDVLENGSASLYADWYFVEFNDDGSVDSWQAWDGPSGWLPKFRQQSNGDLMPGMKQHIFDITARWMDPDGDGDPSDGIDGWRLDVPLDVGLPFWSDWRAHVKSLNADAVIIAEIWDDASAYVQGNYFDTQMHYPFARPVVDWLGVQPGMPSSELSQRLSEAFNEAPQTCLIHQNLFGSHDTDRFVSQLHNPGRAYDQGNRIQDNGPNYDDTRPTLQEFRRAVLGFAIQATYLGAPMVYYGDEYGMWGADDPTDRKPVPWRDLGRPENPADRADARFRNDVREWLRLRQDPAAGPILRYGTVRHLDSGDPDVFAFERELNSERVVVVINRGQKTYDASGLLPTGTRGGRVRGVSAAYWHLP